MLRRLLPTSVFVGAAPVIKETAAFPTVSASSNGMIRPTATLLGNKGGTPKHKKSPYSIRRKSYGIHFKSTMLKTTDWYFCPLCSEPKKEGEWCRREDCRQIKP